ncbi:hypothetical protein IW261DRAFT_1566004 [Armillaria novae-zelandiae]|uniref:Uncharacterized protein n=1 Tax=Armillaria novae-zelandiae TaxID=153914 RepID=A0AA39P4X8_9AGAR|nr:hypothetical protein IW261DRAFT_1566004 [Armillaria novae-zelandiae]
MTRLISSIAGSLEEAGNDDFVPGTNDKDGDFQGQLVISDLSRLVLSWILDALSDKQSHTLRMSRILVPATFTSLAKKRPMDQDSVIVDRPGGKKPHLHEVDPAPENKVVVATKAVRTCGPGLTKPPPVTIGVSGGGFSEDVLPGMKAIRGGIKSIGVLVVDKDFGQFVEVDKAFWNKEVAPFMGEQYVDPCDQCRHKGMQCHKFLTHTVICVCCHYSKSSCHVDKVPALNPICHYHLKSFETVDAFQGALDMLDQHFDAIEDLVLHFLSGANVLSQLNGLHIQSSCLHECMANNAQHGKLGDKEDEATVMNLDFCGNGKPKLKE